MHAWVSPSLPPPQRCCLFVCCSKSRHVRTNVRMRTTTFCLSMQQMQRLEAAATDAVRTVMIRNQFRTDFSAESVRVVTYASYLTTYVLGTEFYAHFNDPKDGRCHGPSRNAVAKCAMQITVLFFPSVQYRDPPKRANFEIVERAPKLLLLL